MSMNVTSCTYPIYQQNLQQNPTVCIENHPAWKGIMDQSTAESLLKERDFYTYLLYRDINMSKYTISFLDMSGKIQHQNYYQESNNWVYYNALSSKAANINDLVSHMMHCKPKMCKPLE